MAEKVSVAVLVNEPAWLQALPQAEAVCREAAEAALRASPADSEGPAHREGGEISVVLSDDGSVRALNRAWRGEDKATNVLAFPAADAAETLLPGQPLLLGDVVVAYETTAAEAAAENKLLQHHLCHLVVHGTMHLLGHDHQTVHEAEMMERLEVNALALLGIANPYDVPGADDGPRIEER